MKKIYKHIISLALLSIPMVLSAQTQTENHVVSKVYRKATQTPQVTNHKDSVAMSIQYFDGLGRPKQSVAVQAGGILTHRNSLLYDWTLGNTGSTPFYNQEGTNAENTIVNGTTPFGDTDLLWECKDTDGGGGAGWITDPIAIDKTKAYRYTVWVKRTHSNDGNTLFGTHVVAGLDGTNYGERYFFLGDLPQFDTWYLLVGIIHSHDHTGGDQGISGVYDTQGNKVLDADEYKWQSTSTVGRFRSYLFTGNASDRQYFWSPLLQKMDGTEMPLNDVVNAPSIVTQEATAKDIVTPIAYDQYGRQMKQYLPYASGYSNGRINTDGVAKNQAYYLDKHAGDFPGITDPTLVNAYSEKTMENSPLGRIYEQTAPGSDWIKGTNILAKGYSDGHTIKFEYHSNGVDEVKKYTVSTTYANKTYTPALSGGSTYYPVGELTKTMTKDENWESTQTNLQDNTTEEFKNKNGQVILKRTYNNNQKHDTYYLYDDYGNLTYVLPPKAEGTISAPTSTVLNELCYQYKYDYRNRLVEKKIPGKGWELIIYDKLDRPVITSGINQYSTGKWLFTKYDQLGRVAFTGVRQGYTNRTALQNEANTTSSQYVSRGASTTLAGTAIHYTNTSFPVNNINEILTINYYDDYNNILPIGFVAPTSVYGNTITTNTKGLATVSKVRVLGTTNWTTTISYYDEKARPIYIYSKNEYLGTTDIVESKLDDFTGRVIETKTTHQKTGQVDVVTIDNFEYDHRDRLIAQTQKVNNQTSERLVQNHYDELGQLESKLVGNGAQKGYKDVTSGLSITDDVIIKTGTNGWDTGLATIGSIEKDGYVEFVVTQTNRYAMIGLSDQNINAHYTKIDYAIYLYSSNRVRVYENGSYKGVQMDNELGDRLRVERIGDKIHYKINGETFYISAVSSNGSLLGDAAIYSLGTEIKDLHLVDNSKGLQKVDYTYNVRGWLKNINQDSDNDNDLFNFSLRYNNPTSGVALYNGNISQTSWNTLSTDTSTKTYTYSYDALNRILSGIDNTGNYNLTSVSYDKNGNILNLERQGHTNVAATTFGVMDDLTYSYDNGNRLLKVADAATIDQFGFKDDAINTAADTTNDYTYDNNGNMITDTNKGITNISYNYLNLPTKVTFGTNDANSIEYTYDATGVKLEKRVIEKYNPILGTNTFRGIKTETTQYASNYIYKKNSDYDDGIGNTVDHGLQFFNHAEGYVTTDGNEMSYIYQYKDHLGNVRLSYADTNNDGTIDAATEIVEESNYYPFGLKHKGYNYVTSSNGNSTAQKFKFNGMELENSLGIDWYEMDMRQYDPAIARWTSIDPVVHHSNSTYNGFDNNPVYFADPSGANSQVHWGSGFGPSGPEAPKELSGETTYSYQNGSSTYDRHTVKTTTTQKFETMSKDGNTKTVDTYTSTITSVIIKKQEIDGNDSNNDVKTLTGQTVNKYSETFSKDNEGNWVSNGNGKKVGLLNSSTQIGEGLIGGDGNLLDGSRIIANTFGVTHESALSDVTSFVHASKFGENFKDDSSLYQQYSSGVSSGLSLGGAALAVGGNLTGVKWLVNGGRLASGIGIILSAKYVADSFTGGSVKDYVLRRFKL